MKKIILIETIVDTRQTWEWSPSRNETNNDSNGKVFHSRSIACDSVSASENSSYKNDW